MINKLETYSELYFILEQVPNSYIKMLPGNFINKLKQQMSLEHYNKFNTDEVFYKQEFDITTITLLEKIYQKYWNEDNKSSDSFSQNPDIIKEIYNPEILFKKRILDSQNNMIETALTEYNESFFTKFKNFIFKILHINN